MDLPGQTERMWCDIHRGYCCYSFWWAFTGHITLLWIWMWTNTTELLLMRKEFLPLRGRAARCCLALVSLLCSSLRVIRVQERDGGREREVKRKWEVLEREPEREGERTEINRERAVLDRQWERNRARGTLERDWTIWQSDNECQCVVESGSFTVWHCVKQLSLFLLWYSNRPISAVMQKL